MKISLQLVLTTVLFVSACSKKNDTTPPPIITTSTPSVITFAGSGSASLADGTKTLASFNFPTGITMDSQGYLIIADKQNNAIRVITPQGVVSTVAGTGTAGFSNTAGAVTFNFPSGVATDSNGNIFVADQGNSSIRQITPAGVVSTFAGTGSGGNADGAGASASFNQPSGIATDLGGNVYVADNGNNTIRKIATKGLVTTLAGSGVRGAANGAGAAAQFNQPEALVVDGNGNVYVADEGNNMIRKITPSGVVTTLAGSGQPGSANGVGTAATFNKPAGITIDANGNLYVGDSGNNLIREIAPDGTVTTYAGTGGAGSQNGTLSTSSFTSPQGVVVDQYGRVFIADTGNSLIREINP